MKASIDTGTQKDAFKSLYLSTDWAPKGELRFLRALKTLLISKLRNIEQEELFSLGLNPTPWTKLLSYEEEGLWFQLSDDRPQIEWIRKMNS